MDDVTYVVQPRARQLVPVDKKQEDGWSNNTTLIIVIAAVVLFLLLWNQNS